MEYISSDTNVWVDFAIIDKLDLPFKLPYIYIMDENTIADELLAPPDMKSKLLKLGLQSTELTENEYWLAEEYHAKYRKLSLYDCIALSIAKCRFIVLLTGDNPLRKAAAREGVSVLGTIGLLDQLFHRNYISSEEYKDCLVELRSLNGKKVRLPEAELNSRIETFL